MNKPEHTPPMVHMTASLWVMVFLVVVAFIPFLWSFRPAKRTAPKPRHHVPADVVRRELAPHETQLSDVARINELFPEDAEEGDHADA